MEYNTAVLTACAQFVLLCFIGIKAAEPSGDGGGWSSDSGFRLQDEGDCNIDILDGFSLSHQQFIERYAYSRPVILRGLTDNTRFRSLCSKASLLEEYGARKVRLSTANTFSYRKVDIPLQEYVDDLLRPQSADALGSETLYFFGDNNFTEWQSLFEQYESPPYALPHTSGAYSFGIAGSFCSNPITHNAAECQRVACSTFSLVLRWL
ncbi:jmjC domain-containing protein 8 [Notothenia coriiceps]|uniref:JmjC domain-containing protein 8 n=1 Tax=Notothenia coriiceps TaxID=8208 RepID=A0A6I9P3F2_9TELE|nr:PREDICTED: jmjC domain-containing protein 8 [Notothenia coriiceps]